MASTLLSRVLGVLRTRILAQVFGSGSTADVINFTFNIPNNFRKLFGEGAVNSALIPTFSALGVADERAQRLYLFRLLCTYQILLFIPIVLISYVWRTPLIALLSDFNAEQITLGAQLLPPFMLYLLFISMAAIFGGVLQSHHSFVVAYLSPLCFSIVVIAGVLTLTPSLGAMSMAVSTVGGGFLQAAVSYGGVRRHGYRLNAAFRVNDTPFFTVLKAWALVSVGMLMQVITQLVTYRFASQLPTGSVTALANSTIFYQTPYGIFFNAISAVSLPLLAAAWALEDWQRIKSLMSSSLANLAALLIPSTIILYTLSAESVATVLQTGLFTGESTVATAYVLRPYLLFMTPLAFYALMLRLGYSSGRYWAMTVVVIIQNLLDITLMWTALRLGFGIIALPVAAGISSLIGLGALSIVLRGLYNPLRDGSLAVSLVRIGVANLPLLGVSALYRALVRPWWASGSSLTNLAILALLGTGALALVLISYRLMNIPLTALAKRGGKG